MAADGTTGGTCRRNLAALALAAILLSVIAPVVLLALAPVVVLTALLIADCYPGERALIRAAARRRRSAPRPAPFLPLAPRGPRDRRPSVGGPLGRGFAVRPPPRILAISR